MFAVIKTGGKQYRVAADDVLKIAKVKGESGRNHPVRRGAGGRAAEMSLLASLWWRAPSVAAEVLEQGRGPKIIAFKKRRRKNSRRKRGHRQEFTRIRVTEILTEGAAPGGSPAAAAARDRAVETAASEAAVAGPAPLDAPEPTVEALAGKKANARVRRSDFVTKRHYMSGD